MPKPPSTWKSVERKIAKIFGVERTGPLGDGVPDCISDPFAVEIKHGAAAPVPKWLSEAMDQAERNAPGRLSPVVVLHPKGWRIEDSLVVMRLSEFRDLFLG